MPNVIKWHHEEVKTANTAKDGSGTMAFIVTALTDTYVDRVVFRAIGSNVATVARLFVNNGGDNATAANNVLIAEMTLPITTLSETSAITEQKIVTDLWLPARYRLTVALGTTVAAGYMVYAVGGIYQNLQSSQIDGRFLQ